MGLIFIKRCCIYYKLDKELTNLIIQSKTTIFLFDIGFNGLI